MIHVTQRGETAEYMRPASSYQEARRVLFEAVESLRLQGVRVWGSMKSGYSTVIDGELIQLVIE